MRPYLLKGHSRPLTQLKCVLCCWGWDYRRRRGVNDGSRRSDEAVDAWQVSLSLSLFLSLSHTHTHTHTLARFLFHTHA